MTRFVVLAALVVLLAAAAPAQANTFCVGFSRAGCENGRSASEAFAQARDGDRIELGEIETRAALDDAGRALDVAGAGEGMTVLAGGLTLSAAGSRLMGATVHGLTLGGTATRVRVEGAARLHGGVLRSALVRGGGLDASGAAPRLETVVLDLTAGAGLRVGCSTLLHARHVTLTGTPAAAVTTECQSSEARIVDSILWGPPGAGFAGPGRVVTDHSDYRLVAGHADGPGDRHVDPGFAPGTQRLAPGSPLLDAGTPGGLAGAEWTEDRDRLPRVADGNGDGAPVRDPGAFELAPPAVPLPAQNLLGNPSAEDAGAWTVRGGFTRERYGAFPFPSAAAGSALGAGDAFFAGGPTADGAATQAVGVTGLAPEIDLGLATVSLSGLLGGFRTDADSGTVTATFLGPRGWELGSLALATPTPAERGNATALLARATSAAVPPLTRRVSVAMHATLTPPGDYKDAYFDNLGLTVSAPGAPGPGALRTKPFAGLRVLGGRVRIDRRGRLPVRLACADATVGGCSGAITLAGARHRRGRTQRLATARVDLPPGTTRRVRLSLARTARRALRARRRIPMTLYVAVRDGQGVARLSTVPVTVKWRTRRRAPSSSPVAGP